VLRRGYLNAMRGLEAGLSVRDIAVFSLLTCNEGEQITRLQDRVAPYDFDNVPVHVDCPPPFDRDVVGVVEDVKAQPTDAVAREVMTPLSEGMLISGAVSLVRFLPRIADRKYRLVVEDERIMGLVTPSDVVQLPVRLLVFASLTHLEETMTNVLRWKVNDDQDVLLDALRPDRRGAVAQTLERLGRADLNPTPANAMAFGDKTELVFDIHVIDEEGDERSQLLALRDLRNRIAHAQEYAVDREELEEFLNQVTQIQRWIDRLTAVLPADALALPADRDG
jgi:hypothetical protein